MLNYCIEDLSMTGSICFSSSVKSLLPLKNNREKCPLMKQNNKKWPQMQVLGKWEGWRGQLSCLVRRKRYLVQYAVPRVLEGQPSLGKFLTMALCWEESIHINWVSECSWELCVMVKEKRSFACLIYWLAFLDSERSSSFQWLNSCAGVWTDPKGLAVLLWWQSSLYNVLW